MSEPEIFERYLQAQDIAGRAAALAMVYWRSRDSLAVESKASLQDIVSEADRAVERLIREEVGANFPDDGFLGEEYGSTEGGSGFTWVIDPIDGTSSYLHGIPNWCVAIAVLTRRRDRDRRGIGADAWREIRRDAGRGRPAERRAAADLPEVTIRNAVTGIGSSQHSDPATSARWVAGLVREGGVFFRNGSGALMLAYVAAGRLAGYLSQHMNAWDCLAGFLLVREAGGRTAPFRIDGDYSRPDRVLAAAPSAWADLSRLMHNE